MKVAIAVHGGAWNIPDALMPAHMDGCRKAQEIGLAILNAGGSALEAVAAAIRHLEDDPTYDAGYGSFLNSQGEVELDAGLMEGQHLKSGAVLGVSRVKNPIDLALHVLHSSDHCIFSGDGAHQLAEAAGFTLVDPAIHIHPREAETHRRIHAGDQSILASAWSETPHDTVGAIALDAQGNLACGNSTGGILQKAPGRVGDAPLIGCGFYADNQQGAMLCTGWGESIMRSAMGMQGLLHIPFLGVQAAADWAIKHLSKRVNGFGGILLMSPQGHCAHAHNTTRMATCY